jgi:uncharacterized phage protein (TIGR01671 family)
MKRFIHFRVWDKLEKKFEALKGSVIHINDDQNATLMPLSQDYVIQQSIGLKDIDGREIFEGDVVDLYAKKNSTYKPKALHQGSIRWVTTFAGFGVYQYKDGQELPLNKFDPKKLRVINNIYEDKQPNSNPPSSNGG